MHKKCLVALCLWALNPWLGFAADEVQNPVSSPIPSIAVSNPTQNSIQIYWEPISQVSRYELSYGTDPDAKNRGQMFVTTSNTTLSRLLSNTTYNVKVRAILAGRAGEWSRIIEFSTQIPVMTDFEADSVRDNSAHFTWSDRYRDLPETFYEISFGTDLDAKSKGTRSTNSNFITIHDLSVNTTYYAKLRVCNPKTAGPWSVPITFTTRAFSTELTPGNINFTRGTGSALLLRWNALSEAESYDVSYGMDPVAETIGILPAVTNSISFNLSPNTQYYFKVRSIIKGSTGPWSTIVPYLTLPDVPRGLNILAQTADQTIIGWQSLANPHIQRLYQLQWGPEPFATTLGTTIIANASYTLSSLKTNQQYAVRVRALNASGTSEWSKSVSFTTLPAGLAQLRVFDIKHKAAKIEWPGAADILAYELSYGSDAEAENKRTLEIKKPLAELTDLIPEVTYYVKVRPVLLNQQIGAWSNIINFTTFPVPPLPRAPFLAEAGATYVALTWTAVPQITTYDLLLATDDVLLEGETHTFHEPKANLRNLKANMSYRVKIRAVNLGGPGDWSESTSFITLPKSAPGKLSIDSITQSEALVHWDGIEGTVPASYQLRLCPDKASWETINCSRALTRSLTGLTSDTKYLVQISALNAAGQSPWSDTVSFKTLAEPPSSAPTGLIAKAVSDISVTLQWQPMPLILGYKISRGTDTDASNQGVEILSKPEYLVQGLNPDSNFFVKVKAYNSTGEGPWSDCLMLTTLPSPPIVAPTNVFLGDITESAISLGWDYSSQSRSYQISIGTDPRGENGGDPISTQTQPYTITNLKPNTTYYVKVRNVNRGGGGPWSRLLKATTLP